MTHVVTETKRIIVGMHASMHVAAHVTELVISVCSMQMWLRVSLHAFSGIYGQAKITREAHSPSFGDCRSQQLIRFL